MAPLKFSARYSLTVKCILALAAMLQASSGAALACTDFLVHADDGTNVVGRSMEWGLNLDSKIWQYPRGMARSSQSPDGKTGVKWQSQYGYLGLDCHGMPLALDGINEAGLSMDQLWLPGTVYQEVPAASPQTALCLLDLGHYILGNFSTVDQVKNAIKDVRVWSPTLSDWGGIPTTHLAIHDSSGKSIVIEFVGGEQKIYDNPLHVLTNAPTFDWHITNLRNYIKLSAANAKTVTVGGSVLAPPGQGGGFLGIPGDWTPPSRFVRTNAMLQFAKPASNAKEAVGLAVHLLNAVDIPLGDVRGSDNDIKYADYTQWIVIKDLTNRVLYFRSYDNSILRAIDLKKLNFDKSGKPAVITAVAGGQPFVELPVQ